MKEILVTTNYEIFKKLNGNRGITELRKEKIKNSILENGYITSPILVNEKMEIIDGQGRFTALKELGLPIEYIIQEGIGVNECVAMNINQTNWSIRDYIKSYANRGFEDYIRIQDILDKYTKYGINLNTISVLINDGAKIKDKTINKGTLKFSEEQYIKTINELEKIKDIAYKNRGVTRLNLLLTGILHCTYIEKVDIEKLINKVSEVLDYGKIPPIPTVDEVMQYLESLYNRNSKKETIYIYTEYRKLVEERVRKGSKVFVEMYKKYNEEKEGKNEE